MKKILIFKKILCLVLAQLLFAQSVLSVVEGPVLPAPSKVEGSVEGPVLLAAQTSKSAPRIKRSIRQSSKQARKDVVKAKQTPTNTSVPVAAAPTEDKESVPDARQVRAIVSRKEQKSPFEKNIEEYVLKIKNAHGHKDAMTKPFADVIQKITFIQKTAPLDLLKQIQGALAPLKKIAGQAVVKSDANQQLGVAVLLKAAMPLGAQAQTIICETLHRLDSYITYWREQKHHPVTYFFHKNPKKWFIGPKQKKEIEDSLHQLGSIRDDHLRLLARLAEHESLFNPAASLKDQYEWLAKYLSMIFSVCSNRQAKIDGIAQDELIRFEKLLTLVSDMLSLAPLHEHNVARALGGAKKPGHFTRNWIAYSGLAIGSIAFMWYARKNQGAFQNWLYNDIQQGLTGFYRSVVDNGQEFYRAMMGKHDEEQEAVDLDQVQRNVFEQFDNLHQSSVDGAANLRTARDNIRNEIQPALNAIEANVRNNVQQEFQNLVQYMQANRPQHPLTPDEAIQSSQAAVLEYQQTRNQLVQNGLLPEQEPINLNGVPFANLEAQVIRVLNSAMADLNHIAGRLNDDLNPPLQNNNNVAGANAQRARNALADVFVRAVAGGENTQRIDNFMRDEMPIIMRLVDRVPDVAGLIANIGTLVLQYGVVVRVHVGNLLEGGVGLAGAAAQGTGAVADLVDGMSQMMGVFADQMQNASDLADGSAAILAAQVPQVDANNNPVMQVGENGQQILDANGHPVPVMVPGPLRAGVSNMINLTKKADRLLTQNQATFILAALVPAGLVVGGTLWGAHKVYKGLKHKPDFQPMREALIDIGHLLNEEGISKKYDTALLDQGKILYLVWKLKREAENVPALVRDQFLADVAKLGRNDLDEDKLHRVWTAEKKLRVVDLMYRTYDFLNPAYTVQ